MFFENKAFVHGMVDSRKQRGVIIFCVQQPDRFFMMTDLTPSDGLEQFVEGAVTAGQSNETIRQFVHTGFTGVHIGWNIHAGQPVMC